MFARIMAILTMLTLVCAAGVPAQTLDKVERTCAAAKLKATAKKENAKLKCEATALLKDLAATNADCLAKAEAKFATAFEKAETRGGCVSDLDSVTVEASVDQFVTSEVARQKMLIAPLLPCDTLEQPCGTCEEGICAITDEGQVCVATTGGFMPCPIAGCPAGFACYHMIITVPFLPPMDISTCLPSCNTVDPPSLDKLGRTCAASKLKATGKNALSKFKCEAKAILKELASADAECLGKADTKLDTALGKAEAKGGCVSTGDAADIKGTVDSFVAAEVSRQKEGSLLPACTTASAPCGSCGSGTCVAADQGLFCVAMGVPTVSPCPVEGCPDGSECLTAGAYSVCATGCP